jgi:hypothetical protein
VDPVDTYYIVEDDPPGDRPRWYCHEHPHGFDDVDEAVAWALFHARTAIVRTLGRAFYYAGDAPSDWDDAAGIRPWPPSPAERAAIEAAYARALEAGAREEEAWLEYLLARDAWLTSTAPELTAKEPEHRSLIESPDGVSIEFEEFDGGSRCCGRQLPFGPVAFGSAAEVVAGTKGLPTSDLGSSPSSPHSSESGAGAPDVVSTSTYASGAASCSTSRRRGTATRSAGSGSTGRG